MVTTLVIHYRACHYYTVSKDTYLLNSLTQLGEEFKMETQRQIIEMLKAACKCNEELCECSFPVTYHHGENTYLIAGFVGTDAEIDERALKRLTGAKKLRSGAWFKNWPEERPFLAHCQRFRNPEYRYSGFKNFHLNCWFNAARLMIRLVGEEDLIQLFEHLPHTKDVVNSFYRAGQVIADGSGWFEGGFEDALVRLYSRSWSTDYDGAIYQHRYVVLGDDADTWENTDELPTMILSVRDHVVVAAKEDDHWVIYDDDNVWCVRDWRTIPGAAPRLGSAGINMLQLVPAQWPEPPKETPKQTLKRLAAGPLDDQAYAETLYHWINTDGFRQASYAKNYDVDSPMWQLYRKHHSWFTSKLMVVQNETAVTQGGGNSKPQQGNVNGSQNQGYQVYNYYNQQYQNSVDMSTPVNNVGGASGNNTANSQHNNSNQSLSGLLTQVFGMASNMLPLMLMDPDTEESTQLPDRITEETAGATKVTTQSSVGTLVGYRQLRSRHPVTSCADKPSKPGPDVHRNYVMNVGTWSQTQAAYSYLRIPLPTGLVDMGVFSAVARRHYLFKCGWKIQVQLNTSNFHAGCLGVFAVPEDYHAGATMDPSTDWQNDGVDRMRRKESYFLYPHQLINCRTNTSVDLILPYLNCVPTTAYGFHSPWTLYFIVLTPLQIPTGASPVVDIAMTIQPMDVQYNGLRQPLVEPQSYPVHVRENQAMFASTVPDTTIPVYGLGFAPNTDFVPGEVSNFLEWARTPCLMSIPNGSNGWKGYITASNTRSDTPLLDVEVTLASDHLRWTPIGQLGQRYSQYRGSINVMCLFTGAAMVKGKFLICYTPPGAGAPNSIEEAMLATYAIWDLGLQSSYNFVIPFISASDFRITYSNVDTITSMDGHFTIFQYTALTYPANTPQNSDVLVFFSAGDDFCFRNMTDVVVYQGLDNAEQGDSENPTAAEDYEAAPLVSEIQHTGLGYVFDRSWYLASYTNPSTVQVQTLSVYEFMRAVPKGGQDYQRQLWSWLSSVTYFKADIEVTIIPIDSSSPRIVCKYFPVGAIIPNYTSLEQLVGNTGPCPLMVNDRGRPLTFTVPYTSPLSVLATSYLGYSTFSRDELSQFPPNDSFGNLLFQATDNCVLAVYVRFKNFRGFVPRPFHPIGSNPSATRVKSQMDVVMAEDFQIIRPRHRPTLLSGDVEMNPGPGMWSKEEVAFTQGLDKLYNFFTGGLFNEAKGTAEDIHGMTHNMKKLTDYAVEAFDGVRHWVKITKKMFRMFVYMIIAYRSKDPVVTGLLLADMVYGDPFDAIHILKTELQKIFKSPPPPIAHTQGVNDLNQIFNLMKNAEWAVKLIKHIGEWLQKWMDQEMELPERQLQKELSKALDYIEVLEKKNQESQKVLEEAIPHLQKVARLARLANKQAIANLCDATLKPYNMSSDQRAEPIVILLKGKPGQGKTVIATLLAQMISKELVGIKSVYTLPPDSKHMDGYNGQAVVIMDDLGQNPDGMDFATFCQMVSTANFVTPQAAINDKGTLFTSKVIIATTNLDNIRPVTIAEPAAVLRRFTYNLEVEAVCKDFRGLLDIEDALSKVTNAFDGNVATAVPKCLTHLPKILTVDGVRLRQDKVIYSGLSLFNAVMDELRRRDQVKDRITGIVQGYHAIELTKIATRTTYEQGKVTVETVKAEMKAEHDDMTALQKFCALAPVFIAVVRLMMMFFEMYSRPSEAESESDEEAECEGPYNGAGVRKQPAIKKTVVQGAYSGIPKKKTPKIKKVVTQATEPIKELKAKFVVVNATEMAETQGPRADAEKSILERNTTPVNYYKNGKEVCSLTAVKLCDNKALINKHQFDRDIWDTMEIAGIKIRAEDAVVVGMATKSGIPYDLYVVDVPGMQCRNITHMFTDDEPRHEVLIGCCNSNNYQKMLWQGDVLRCVESLHTDAGVIPKTVVYSTPTKAGFCGAPLVGRRDGVAKIIAIHAAGNGVNGYGALVTKSMIEEAVTQGIIYGQEPGPYVSVNRKTSLKKSPLFNVFEPEAGPAVLSQHDRRLCDGVVLDEALFEKHVSDMDILPQEFEVACDMYAAELFPVIGKENGLCSIYEAMNGDGISDPMAMDKSVGYPHCLEGKSRLDLITITEGEEGKKIYHPTPQLVQEVCDYFTGEKKPKFVTFLKDEIRSNEKVRMGKTRIVDASPFAYAISGRMVLQRFMSNMMRRNGTAVGSAVGCDPDTEWTRYFFELADRYVFDIDYKAFDATHTTAMFELLKRRFFLDKYGFDNQAVCVFIDGLSDSDHVYEDKHFKMRGGLPSGCPATSILNTVINNITIRAAILGAYQVDTVDFSKFRMLAYGDDVVYATPQPIKPADLAEWLHKHTNYKTTPASKNGEFPDESTIWDVTFLKRAFVPDEDMGHLIKPQMKVENLKTMLSFMRPGTFQDKVRSVAGLAVHNGEEVYEQLGEAIQDAAPGIKWPAYSYMKQCWYAKMNM
nr:polyprotein [Mosavirus sp.]